VSAIAVLAATREMLIATLTLATPFLSAAILSALVFGLVQAGTRINDLTLGFVPRFAAVMLAIWLGAHWSIALLTAYFARALRSAASLAG
jgi:flagellar biosynthesis protein FliQ